ncbi:MAG: hypothetical protein KF760_13965 [Candidatus Eremiobacteraeota bacterium]|nr:hypothetical protein [Candidatus Eremiobacteraeota bacterium]
MTGVPVSGVGSSGAGAGLNTGGASSTIREESDSRLILGGGYKIFKLVYAGFELSEFINLGSKSLKSVRVHNATSRAVLVKTSYHSVFSAPEAPLIEVQARVPAGSRKELLTRQEGCLDQELTLQVSPGKALTQRLNSPETQVVIR